MTFREFNREIPVFSKIQVYQINRDEEFPTNPFEFTKVVDCGALKQDKYLDIILEEYGRQGFEEILDKEVIGMSASGDVLNILISND